jgi:hypothetical protein
LIADSDLNTQGQANMISDQPVAMDQKNFRRLILLYVLLGIAAVGAAFMPGSYSQALGDVYEDESSSSLMGNIGFMLAVMLPLLVVTVIGLYGLYMFKAWGRVVCLASTVGSLIVLSLSGPVLYGAIEGVLWELSSLVWGGILTLSYFSPLAHKFTARA